MGSKSLPCSESDGDLVHVVPCPYVHILAIPTLALGQSWAIFKQRRFWPGIAVP